MSFSTRKIFLLMGLLFSVFLCLGEEVQIKTKAQENKLAVFQYRVPKEYDANRGETYRVLVIFGGRNTDGKADASGRMGLSE